MNFAARALAPEGTDHTPYFDTTVEDDDLD
ncbi:hypothetical protein EDF38_0502 [Frigoribacterium sp. PhB160]|jgi:hypothetical protein|nr:hypothetical protein EDF38_0502 [Frigoribacterium sp. PhB160]